MAELKSIYLKNSYKQVLPALASFLILLILEIYWFYPKLFYYILVLLIAIPTISLWLFYLARVKEEKIWNFFILPILFLSSSLFFSGVIPISGSWHKILIQIIFFVNASFIYLYLRYSFYFFITPYLFKEVDFKNISFFGAYLASLFSFSSAFGFLSFLGLPIWLLTIVIIFFVFFLTYINFWVEKISIKTSFLYIIIISFLIFQFSWALAFLPLSFYLIGLILSIIYYLMIKLAQFNFTGNLNKNTITRHLLFGLISITIILLTSRWI